MNVDVRELYQDVILRHARAPQHMRKPAQVDASAAGDNPMCGDRCEVFVRYGAGGIVDEVGYEGRGCAISMASADLMAMCVGETAPHEIRTLAQDFFTLVRTGRSDREDSTIAILKPLAGVAEYPSRIKCATLPWSALLAALDGDKEATSE